MNAHNSEIISTGALDGDAMVSWLRSQQLHLPTAPRPRRWFHWLRQVGIMLLAAAAICGAAAMANLAHSVTPSCAAPIVRGFEGG